MSKPHDKQNPPAQPGQTKTMFVTEGNSYAAVVTSDVNGIWAEEFWFADLAEAFQLCRTNRWNFAYTPGVPNN